MQKKLLGVAGCTALMFDLIACSGEDGANGVNGLNGLDGKNGADGTSCYVKALKNKDAGYKILCGGDSVGVLLNGERGDDGNDGKNGKDGKDGKDGKNGTSCNVVALDDGSGYNVICADEKKGVLKNGAKGADGESCTTSSADDGIIVKCGDTETKIYNGVSCTTADVEKNGKKGLAVTCGEKTVTVWDGEKGTDGKNCTASPFTTSDGKSGVNLYCEGSTKPVGTVYDCVSTDNKDGTVDVSCGGADAITIYKAMCGDAFYDPSDKFCVLGKLYDKCGGKTWKVNTQYCDDGEVIDLCSEYKVLRTGEVEFVENRALKKGEFCWNGIIMQECDGKTFGTNEFCGKSADGKKDVVYSFDECPNRDLSKNEAEDTLKYALEPLSIKWPVVTANSSVANNSYFGELIGSELSHPYDNEYESFEDAYKAFLARWAESQFACVEGTSDIKDECGGVEYNTAEKFCDERDNHLYAISKSMEFELLATTQTGYGNNRRYVDTTVTVVWMAENLDFEYKLPKTIITGEGDDAEESISQLAGKVNYETEAYENYVVDGVRYYTWKSATGADDFRTTMGTQIAELNEVDQTIGACPAGWRLPKQSDLDNLKAFADNVQHENGFDDLDFNVSFDGTYIVGEGVSGAEAYYWSSTAATRGDLNQAYGIVIKDQFESEVKLSNKAFGFTVRCVKELSRITYNRQQ